MALSIEQRIERKKAKLHDLQEQHAALVIQHQALSREVQDKVNEYTREEGALKELVDQQREAADEKQPPPAKE
jgi:hypothetical protein